MLTRTRRKTIVYTCVLCGKAGEAETERDMCPGHQPVVPRRVMKITQVNEDGTRSWVLVDVSHSWVNPDTGHRRYAGRDQDGNRIVRDAIDPAGGGRDIREDRHA